MATAQATSEPELVFPPKGALRRYAFPRLVREIARGKITGSLYLLNGETKKVVFFEEGQPVFVRSNVLTECLGQILSSEGLITQEQCEQTLEAIRRTGKKQGELLVEMGILSEGNLRYGLAAQLRTKLYDIFAWEDGRYQFKSDPPNSQFGVRLDLEPEGVILGAIQAGYSEARAADLLSPSSHKYPAPASPLDDDLSSLRLLPEEVYFLRCIDGSRSVSDLVDDDVARLVPSPRALVYGLLQAGVIELREDASEPGERPEQPDFSVRPPDESLLPTYEAQDVVTEYEDTPLPGELPQVRGLLGDHEADFADVEALETGTGISAMPEPNPAAAGQPVSVRPEVSEELVAAEPDRVEETFDDIDLEEQSGPNPVDIEPIDDPTEDPTDDPIDEALEGALEEMQAASPQPMPADAPGDSLADAPDESADGLGDDVDELEEIEEIEEIEDVEEFEELELDDDVPAQPALIGEGPAALLESQAEPEPPMSQADQDLGATRAEPLQLEDAGLTMGDAADDPVSFEDLDADLDAANLDVDGIDGDLDGDLDGGLGGDLDVDDDLLGLSDLDDVSLGESDFDIDMGTDIDAEDKHAPQSDPLPRQEDPGADDDLADDDLVVDDLVVDDDLAFDDLDPDAPLDDAPQADPLMSFDELDNIDLGGEETDEPAPVRYDGPEATAQQDQDPEMVGAMRFNEAETALNDQRFPQAVALLEEAYENGFDVAELHAMLAYSRFMAAGQDFETAQHAFELLDYAESMDPSLDLVAAYRGSLFLSLGENDKARDALSRALELNPYCELAIQLMDGMG